MKRNKNTRGKQSSRLKIDVTDDQQKKFRPTAVENPNTGNELKEVPQHISQEKITPVEPIQFNPPIHSLSNTVSSESQSKTTMLFAAFFLGAIGLHRLLMGYKNWWIMLLTLGGFGIWALIDFTRIALGKMPMANGVPLEK